MWSIVTSTRLHTDEEPTTRVCPMRVLLGSPLLLVFVAVKFGRKLSVCMMVLTFRYKALLQENRLRFAVCVFATVRYWV